MSSKCWKTDRSEMPACSAISAGGRTQVTSIERPRALQRRRLWCAPRGRFVRLFVAESDAHGGQDKLFALTSAIVLDNYFAKQTPGANLLAHNSK